MILKTISFILTSFLFCSVASAKSALKSKAAPIKRVTASAGMDNPPEGYDQELMKDLQSFKASDLAKDKENVKSHRELNIDLMFQSLQQVVAYCENRTCSEEMFYLAEKVSLITMTKDVSGYASEILAPLYNKNKDAFKKAALRLPNSEMLKILNALKNAGRAEEKGNG